MKHLSSLVNHVLASKLPEPDSGIQAILRYLSSVSSLQEGAIIVLDLCSALMRRGFSTISARVALELWMYTGSLPALSQFEDFLLDHKWSLHDATVSPLSTDFAAFIKVSLQSAPERKLSLEEIQRVFMLVERLCSCTAMVDHELLHVLSCKLTQETSNQAYSIMREYVGLYGDCTNDEQNCILRRELFDNFQQIKSLNPEVTFVVRYLMTVSYARSYVSTLQHQKQSTRCSYCFNALEEFDHSSWDNDYMERVNSDCRLCEDLPLEDKLSNFIQSVNTDLADYCFIPSARLFWDMHERFGFSHSTRCRVAENTAQAQPIYQMAHPYHPLFLSITFDEKT